MRQENITFDNLPQMVGLLFQEIQELKVLVNESARFKVETTPSDRILQLDEVLQLLSCKKATIYKKTSTNEIPHMKIGGKLYFSEKDILEYLKKGKVLSHQEIDKLAESYITKKGAKNDN